MRVTTSALKHGIPQADIRHAALHLLARVEQDDHRWLVIGSDRQGQMLELVIVEPGADQEPYVIHAMGLRSSFYRFLPGRGDD
jgi:hypothetical protein